MQLASAVRIGFVIGAVLVGFVLLTWIFQRNLIYSPSRDLDPRPPGIEEVRLSAADGVEIGAWFFPARNAGGRAVLVFNGNAGNRSHRAPLAEALRDRGWSVMLLDYRGYGDSTGSPSEEGLGRDARAAVAWLEERGDVDPGRIAYFGESLGAGVAADLALERPPAALVLRSPFTSLADVGAVHYPFLPVSVLLWDRYPVLEGVRAYDGPVLVIWGEADTIVPPEQSRAVAEAARRSSRLEISGANHNDAELLDGRRLVERVVRFLEEHV